MQILCGLLFTLGIFWACFSWICLLLPLGFFQPQYQYRINDVIISLSSCFLAGSGYLVWLGWGFSAFQGKIPFVRPVQFWALSLANHTGWLVWFPVFRQESLEQFSTTAGWIYFWLMVNITVAMCAILVCFANGSSESFPDFDPPAAGA